MPSRPGLISVVITVRNEQRHMSDLLDSLVVQEKPFEILIVDANSTDSTRDIVRRYGERFPEVRLYVHSGTRGESRNFGALKAQGQVVAFIDGDCIANPFWLHELRNALTNADIVAGKTIQIGYWAFESLHRVELKHHGLDVTYPSCNLAYWKPVFERIHGFDSAFKTAEDIDLNFRAVDTGAHLGYNENALVYHRARETFTKFFIQAFWNGYGRKQLTLKHGNLWGQYSFREMLRTQLSLFGIARLSCASFGYLTATMRAPKPTKTSAGTLAAGSAGAAEGAGAGAEAASGHGAEPSKAAVPNQPVASVPTQQRPSQGDR
ncbi:MAG: glycosyltransferase [Thermoplasmatota archaeon]